MGDREEVAASTTGGIPSRVSDVLGAKLARGMAVFTSRIIEAKLNLISSPTLLALHVHRCMELFRWQPSSVNSLVVTENRPNTHGDEIRRIQYAA